MVTIPINDAEITLKALKKKLAFIEYNFIIIKNIKITHLHGDYTNLETIKKIQLPIYFKQVH
ncbi:hypothetical protein BAX97_16945 [Elizabethkingia meningoseptica]|nr:hypothetical protein BBD33_06825 [Elizabethkingia meningoseptica]AQX47016.1 hypothetical protein B5G46_06815 [Elizabethkingia meningoseptica]KUY18008.1 hypothetical protein ATB99_07080 [Elizabethkingia meningoseptica]OPB68304.1 hypothetical protein BAY30_07485 [Elizabethkingia meningoseptica]OPC29060.1 hypothetical protein BAX97_16945 [Elizabethkingia meningoseptica]